MRSQLTPGQERPWWQRWPVWMSAFFTVLPLPTYIDAAIHHTGVATICSLLLALVGATVFGLFTFLRARGDLLIICCYTLGAAAESVALLAKGWFSAVLFGLLLAVPIIGGIARLGLDD